MGRLFSLVFKLALLAAVIFLFTAAWIIFDGLIDTGDKADVALVLGPSDASFSISDPFQRTGLDHAIRLYNEKKVSFITVSGSGSSGGKSEKAAMAGYLKSRGIPASAIFEDHGGWDIREMARGVAEIIKSHPLNSVMLVTDYYHATRIKLALSHEGITEIKNSHVGILQKEDALNIGSEVVALYTYLAEVYLLPEAEKVKAEAVVEADKLKVQAEKARETVDKKLNSLPQ